MWKLNWCKDDTEGSIGKRLVEKHIRLLWWWANRISRTSKHRAEECLGTVYIRGVYALQWYDPTKGALAPLIGRHLYNLFQQSFLKHESEAWAIYFSGHLKDKPTLLEIDKEFASHEQNFQLYRIPDREESWAMELLECFDSVDDAWEFMTRDMDHRLKTILIERYREGRSLEAVGETLGITKQRVQQLEAQAMSRLKSRRKAIEKFADLFAKHTPDCEE